MKSTGLILIFAIFSLALFAQTSATSYDLNGNQIQESNKLQTVVPQYLDGVGNEWHPAGPYGGDVMDIAFAPGNSDISFAAAGIPYYRNSTSDNWHIAEGLLSIAPSGITAIESSSNGTLFASGPSAFYSIYKSTDDGLSWTNVSVPISGSSLDIKIDPSDPDVVYVTSNSNLGAVQNDVIARSMDGGNTWTAFNMTSVLPIGWACVNIAIDPDNSQNIFAIGNESFSNAVVIASFDGGSSWQNISGNLPTGKPYNAINVHNGNLFVCGGQLFGGNYMGIYKSENWGSSWSNISSSFPNKVVNDMLIQPDNANKMFAATEGDGVYYTVNGGITWNYDTSGDGDKGSVRSLSFLPGDYSEIHAGYLSLGVMLTTNGGGNWESSTIGIASLKTNDVEFSGDFSGQILVAFEAENSGGCYLANNGEWSLVESLPATRFSTVDVNSEGTLLAWSNGPTTVADEGLYKSTDGGVSWENLGPNIGDVFETEIWSVTTSDTDPNLIFIGGNNFGANGWASMLYKSIDGGTNWVNVYQGPAYDSFKFVYIDPNSNDQVVYAAYKSQDNKGGFLKSTDGGNNWTPANGGLPVDAKWASAIVADPTDSNILYGGVGGYGTLANIYRSEDAGENWLPANISLSNYSRFTDILINPMNTDVIYAATTLDGVYMTSDGQTWEPADLGMPAINITGFSRIFEYENDSLGFFASTFSNSAFHTALYDPTGVGIKTNKKQQEIWIYPNPSSGNFFINTVGNNSISEITILNTRGKEVYQNTLQNNSEIRIEVELAKGIYILQIKMLDGKTDEEKLIIH